jgi:hypothetical protein
MRRRKIGFTTDRSEQGREECVKGCPDRRSGIQRQGLEDFIPLRLVDSSHMILIRGPTVNPIVFKSGAFIWIVRPRFLIVSI